MWITSSSFIWARRTPVDRAQSFLHSSKQILGQLFQYKPSIGSLGVEGRGGGDEGLNYLHSSLWPAEAYIEHTHTSLQPQPPCNFWMWHLHKARGNIMLFSFIFSILTLPIYSWPLRGSSFCSKEEQRALPLGQYCSSCVHKPWRRSTGEMNGSRGKPDCRSYVTLYDASPNKDAAVRHLSTLSPWEVGCPLLNGDPTVLSVTAE